MLIVNARLESGGWHKIRRNSWSWAVWSIASAVWITGEHLGGTPFLTVLARTHCGGKSDFGCTRSLFQAQVSRGSDLQLCHRCTAVCGLRHAG